MRNAVWGSRGSRFETQETWRTQQRPLVKIMSSDRSFWILPNSMEETARNAVRPLVVHQVGKEPLLWVLRRAVPEKHSQMDLYLYGRCGCRGGRKGRIHPTWECSWVVDLSVLGHTCYNKIMGCTISHFLVGREFMNFQFQTYRGMEKDENEPASAESDFWGGREWGQAWSGTLQKEDFRDNLATIVGYTGSPLTGSSSLALTLLKALEWTLVMCSHGPLFCKICKSNIFYL